jgi:hypothetical protein
MFGDGALSFREFVMREPLPLATIHDAVLEFLQGRDDAVLYGAQAVNAYVDESRMTQDVDVMSTRAEALAGDIKKYLNEKFHIATRVRNVREGLGFRVYQLQMPKNRHLVDVRPVQSFPPTQRVDKVLVVSPAELAANKVVAVHERQGTPKGFTDRRDLAVLLLTFPELKDVEGAVLKRLRAGGAGEDAIQTWRTIAAEPLRPFEEDDEF